jgi:hypothetical protein
MEDSIWIYSIRWIFEYESIASCSSYSLSDSTELEGNWSMEWECIVLYKVEYILSVQYCEINEKGW